MNRKGQVWGIIVLLVVLFLFAFTFVSFFPVFQGLDDAISPQLEGEWEQQANDWRKMIWLAPVIGFLLAILWLVINWVKGQGNSQYYG